MKIKFNKQMNKSLVFILFILISISLSFFILGCVYNHFPKLNDFEIIEIKEEKDKLYLYTTKCYNATIYNVTAFDKDDNIIFENSSNSNKIDITDMMIDYKTTVSFKVVTKSEKNETKTSKNIFKFTNSYASFSKVKDHFIAKDEDVSLDLVGYLGNEKYYVELFYKESKILKKEVEDTFISFDYNEIQKYNGRITAKLYNQNNRVVSTFNFYLNAPIVGNIKINSPTNNFETPWNDVTLYFSGGNNATELIIKIYDKKNKLVSLIKNPYQKDQIKINAHHFKENEEYRIELIASYLDYTEISKSDCIYIHILSKETVKPVYVDKNPTFIKKNTQVSLASNTINATIYYTTDGSTPNKNSSVYQEPITISKNTIIKTYAAKENMYDSEVNVYEFNVKEKELVVYLSPSNQYSNKGVSQAGYTNERDMMNKLTDYIESNLKNAGVRVYRNRSSGNINQWLAESNSKKSDFHFAIHSNASINHDVKGMEIYVDQPTSKSFSIASNIYNNLYEIYPYRDEITDRGVKYAKGSLGEANDNFIKCGALIEIAYHDNYNDALWLTQNIESIAENIANSILEFYQIKE